MADETDAVAGAARDWIPGVYNYCDRWCERCPLSTRCQVYAEIEAETQPRTAESPDDMVAALERTFQRTRKQIEKAAEHLGFDSHAVMQEIEETLNRHGSIRKSELVQAAEAYAGLVDQWFRANVAEVPWAVRRLQIARRNLPEPLVVIRHYQTLIATKVFRAIHSDAMADADDDPVQNDANGSAKVALLAMERSAAAWWVVAARWPRHAGGPLSLVAALTNLHQNVERRFPTAIRFARPGFDTGEVSAAADLPASDRSQH